MLKFICFLPDIVHALMAHRDVCFLSRWKTNTDFLEKIMESMCLNGSCFPGAIKNRFCLSPQKVFYLEKCHEGDAFRMALSAKPPESSK
ncbi:MAG: hypothetical protein Q4D61_06280 [Cardiobacteriaceae bacterium]|nr:hypothetical protein [Cardiobacteriaceae bacterium]